MRESCFLLLTTALPSLAIRSRPAWFVHLSYPRPSNRIDDLVIRMLTLFLALPSNLALFLRLDPSSARYVLPSLPSLSSPSTLFVELTLCPLSLLLSLVCFVGWFDGLQRNSRKHQGQGRKDDVPHQLPSQGYPVRLVLPFPSFLSFSRTD